MDALATPPAAPSSDAMRFPALPPEAGLAMPRQSLRRWDGGARDPVGRRGLGCGARRVVIAGISAAMTIVAAYEMYLVLAVGGLTWAEHAVLVLFVVLFAWLAFSTASAFIGFLALLGRGVRTLDIDPSAPLPNLSSRTALLLPTYNEDARRLMSRLQAIYESVEATGQGDKFDFFVLSDTTDPDIWIAEEIAFFALRERVGETRLFYRRRAENTERKAGNIGEWVIGFGGRYAQMIVLDADSLMTGDTVVRLAAAMEAHPHVGLIQTFPVIVNGTTLFQRLQQFAGRVYGPLIAHGIAWWHGGDSNYWGHNAIIRNEAFAAFAGLPQLDGRKPIGGHILSHDFVEAALIRRGGYTVHIAPMLSGSYEEMPPSLTDYAIRDRRWCQGNLQHLGVLPARGLHWMSRLHLLTGIGSYITAPLWFVFLIVGILISLQAQFVRPEYFPRGFALFPQWPAQDPVRAALVFAGTMTLLLMPKLLAYLVLLRRPGELHRYGGALRAFVSLLIETVVSGLIAPVMMVMQSMAVSEILVGKDSGWQVQRRDDGRLPFRVLARSYLGHTTVGVLLAAAAIAVSWPLFLWMTPVIVGLVLAVPLAAVTASAALGRGLQRLGLLATPEERDPPEVLQRANALARMVECDDDVTAPILRLLRNPEMVAAHRAMLRPRARQRGEVDVALVVGLAKLDDIDSLDDALQILTRRELAAVLGDGRGLDRLIEVSNAAPVRGAAG
ncbi:MAG: glucans biosynthesis glucosyltransferase MdoH [Xanthobacteraceae bacterium]